MIVYVIFVYVLKSRCFVSEESMNYHVHQPCYAALPSPPPESTTCKTNPETNTPYPKDLRTEILMTFMESVPIRSELQSSLGVKNLLRATLFSFLVAMGWVGSKSGNETGWQNRAKI